MSVILSGVSRGRHTHLIIMRHPVKRTNPGEVAPGKAAPVALYGAPDRISTSREDSGPGRRPVAKSLP